MTVSEQIRQIPQRSMRVPQDGLSGVFVYHRVGNGKGQSKAPGGKMVNIGPLSITVANGCFFCYTEAVIRIDRISAYNCGGAEPLHSQYTGKVPEGKTEDKKCRRTGKRRGEFHLFW